MIYQIPYRLTLTFSERRILIQKKPWSGTQWKDKDLTDIKNKIRNQLIQTQTTCAYCGLPFKGEKDKQIEHIAPKSDRGRHPYFTFTLLNLVLSCGYCNNLIVKGSKETIKGTPNKNRYRKNQFLLVHPYFDDPNHHYEWVDQDCCVLINAKNDSEKGLFSIKMFDLDSIYMSELRMSNKLLNNMKNSKPLSQKDEDLLNQILDK
jgi:uncharacterized protein (TIGR02646 family)